MGEAKKRKQSVGSSAAPGLTREVLERLSRDLIDKGLLIEGGFAAMRARVMSADAPPDQVSEMRLAFFAGARQLYDCLMKTEDPEADATDADMERMEHVGSELDDFLAEYLLRSVPAEGRA